MNPVNHNNPVSVAVNLLICLVLIGFILVLIALLLVFAKRLARRLARLGERMTIIRCEKVIYSTKDCKDLASLLSGYRATLDESTQEIIGELIADNIPGTQEEIEERFADFPNILAYTLKRNECSLKLINHYRLAINASHRKCVLLNEEAFAEWLRLARKSIKYNKDLNLKSTEPRFSSLKLLARARAFKNAPQVKGEMFSASLCNEYHCQLLSIIKKDTKALRRSLFTGEI